MRFKLDKHKEKRVYWLMQDVYDSLEHSDYLNQHGPWQWQISYEPILSGGPHQYEKRVEHQMKSLERGDVVQPIVVIGRNNVIDGRHKLEAYRRLDSSEVPVARAVRKSDKASVESDSVYEPLVRGMADKGERPGDIICIECGSIMQQKRTKLHCECGRQFHYAELLGWTVPNV